MTVRVLGPADADAFQALRLRGLRECPDAFASSESEEAGTPRSVIAQRLAARPDGAVLGCVEGAKLQGIVGLQRESRLKLAHKAFIWGMYVAPEARRAGIGRALLARALAHAAHELGVRQVKLGVNAQNQAALALYRSLGFEVFGTERDFLQVDGRFHDEHQMVCRVAPGC